MVAVTKNSKTKEIAIFFQNGEVHLVEILYGV